MAPVAIDQDDDIGIVILQVSALGGPAVGHGHVPSNDHLSWT